MNPHAQTEQMTSLELLTEVADVTVEIIGEAPETSTESEPTAELESSRETLNQDDSFEEDMPSAPLPGKAGYSIITHSEAMDVNEIIDIKLLLGAPQTTRPNPPAQPVRLTGSTEHAHSIERRIRS